MRALLTVAVAVALAGCVLSSRTELERRQTAARATIGQIHRAEWLYLASHGAFAETLAELGPSSASLLPEDLAATAGNLGYRFRLVPAGTAYAIEAAPLDFGVTGSTTFYSPAPGPRGTSMVIYEHAGPEPASEAEPRFTYAFKPCIHHADSRHLFPVT